MREEERSVELDGAQGCVVRNGGYTAVLNHARSIGDPRRPVALTAGIRGLGALATALIEPIVPGGRRPGKGAGYRRRSATSSSGWC
jgi:hypothetical protein